MPEHRTCTVDTCELPRHNKTHGWCQKHYTRAYRHGDPHTTAPRPRARNLVGERFGTLTVAAAAPTGWRCTCDCGATAHRRTGDLNRTGDNSTCGNKTAHRRDDIGYGAVHARLATERGPARQHSCTDCGGQARQWSYDHLDGHHELEDGMPYSLNLDHYQPRCVPCHKTYDLAHLTTPAA